MRTVRSLSCDSEEKSPGVHATSTVDPLSHIHSVAADQTLPSLLPSFLHSRASPTAQLDISLALLKVVWPENKTSKNISYYYSLEQERGCGT